MTENEISYKIRACIFLVYNKLGPGLLESAYEAALRYEIEKIGLKVQAQVGLPMVYESIQIEAAYRIDLLVEDKIIIEIKSVEELNPIHHKQIITYLNLSSKRLGILVNFNTDNLASNIFRKVNKLQV